MSDIQYKEAADRLLDALSEQLAAAGERYELIVVGGSGLLALGVINRATRDVDLVALRGGDGLESADPLPPPLRDAARLVARDFGLSPDWLNSGPTALLALGLPSRFSERLESRDYGEALRSTSPRAMTRSTSSSTPRSMPADPASTWRICSPSRRAKRSSWRPRAGPGPMTPPPAASNRCARRWATWG